MSKCSELNLEKFLKANISFPLHEPLRQPEFHLSDEADKKISTNMMN